MNEWKWHRKKNKSTLVLFKDGKKIGSVVLRENAVPDNNAECGWNDLYVAYNGGGRIGSFTTMTEAKIAVETALGVSTKKSKKKPEPERI
jgi:hypothetical protein